MFQIECPSGAVFEFKEIGGREIIAIAERVGPNASGDTITTVLGGCMTRTVDPGPYGHLKEGPGVVDWKRLLEGDALTALLRLRVASFPDIGGRYEFDFTCEHCKAVSGGEIDLGELLADEDANQALPEASAAILGGDGAFTATLTSSGGGVTFDLKRIAQDAPMQKLLKQQQRKRETPIEAVAKQLRGVDGLVSGKTQEPVRDLKALWTWATKLSASDIDGLLAQMRAADCGIDPVILVWCDAPECGRQSRIALPFGRNFFMPRSGTKKGSTGKAASSGASSPA